MRAQLDVVEQPPPADRAHREGRVEGYKCRQQQPRIGLANPVEDRAHVDLDSGEQERQDGKAQAKRKQRAEIEEALAERRRSGLLGLDFARVGRHVRIVDVQRHGPTACSRATLRRSAASNPRPSSTPTWMLTLCTNRLSNML